MWIYGVIIIFIVGYWMFGPGNGVPVKSDWNTVAQMIEQGDVEKIQVVNRDLAEIYLKKDAADRYRKDAAARNGGSAYFQYRVGGYVPSGFG